MLARFSALGRDKSGSAAMEFVIAVPILVMMIWGIFQIAIVLMANAGMQNALGQGARLATVWPIPTDTQIQSKITSGKFGLGNGTWDTPTITTSSTTKTISVAYHQPTNFLFFAGPTVNLTASKVVYLSK